jgi:hypothetical protein
MLKRSTLVGAAAALITLPLMGLSAWGAPCVTGSVASYEVAGFSCNVGSVLFSNIAVNTITTGSGMVALGNFTPFTDGVESGLSLNYVANTGTTPGSAADVAWIYNVADLNPGGLVDAFVSLATTVTGTGQSSVSEVLSNGVTLSLNGAGATTATFAPIGALGVIKDQNNFAGAAGSASASILQNAFSEVPGPIVGAGLPGLVAACGGLLALARRRRKLTCSS